MDPNFIQKIFLTHQDCPQCPSPQKVSAWFEELLGLLFSDLASKKFQHTEALEAAFLQLKEDLIQILQQHPKQVNHKGPEVGEAFFERLPDIYDRLAEDKSNLFQLDPAAQSESEVIKSYPGFFAMAAYRIAHGLHELGVKMIPRMITEFAHSKTGIDIHPGAQIGHRCFIDHGTGVVIGETCIIGDDVKIYQGVTLGALNLVEKEAKGQRHPTIEDHVILYAGATVLGGDTVIGHHSIIGGNTWITKSVAPYSKVYYHANSQEFRATNPDTIH